jgi:hypothetical protein
LADVEASRPFRTAVNVQPHIRRGMLNGLGFPPSGLPLIKGTPMPTDQEKRRIERDRTDQNILRRAAAWLRHDPNRAGVACLNRNDALALAELLDVLATALPDVDSRVHWQAVESCRLLLGEPTASPAIRRTRRRH